jgi:hypothetical protein
MSTLITIIEIALGFGLGLFLMILAGERYCDKNPNSKFKRWWRNTIVGEYEQEEN